MRLHSEGRGKFYGPVRGVIESMLRVVYRNDWPARAWSRVPGACRVTRVTRMLPMLAPGAPTLRVGFASDLHIGPTTPPAILEAAVTELAQAELDVLMLGGDYVFLDATPEKARALGHYVSRIPAKKKLAVLGNHDLWTRHELLEAALENHDVQVLINERVQLEGAHAHVAIVGLDEPWTGGADEAAFVGLPVETRTVIVLCHSPEALPLARRALAQHHARVGASPLRALYLCGHTHGGHLAAPWGPLVVPGKIGRRHHAGEFVFEELTLHVSRGVGATEVSARAFAPPDVLVFELCAGEPAGPPKPV